MATQKPIIALTMGDAAGIGPEIIVKALSKEEAYQIARTIVFGDLKMLNRAAGIVHSDLAFRAIRSVSEARFEKGVVDCLDLDLLPADLPFGKISAEAGHAAYVYLAKAIELAKQGAVDTICTAPLNKEALHKGGHMFPGHTEILAELTGTKNFAMMFSSPDLCVILVTIHEGLIESIQHITPEKVFSTIQLADETLKRAGIDHPRIAVCGINPHAGENGLFGNREEETQIVPALEKATAAGMHVFGPLPADTAFFLAKRGDYDMVVSMYHDQGLGPIKVLGLEASVNITVGLPFIRTSVDHGTAFNIAGTGKADESNMLEALRQAVKLTIQK